MIFNTDKKQEISFAITWIYYILKYIKIENSFILKQYNFTILLFFYCIFDQINTT